MNPPSKDIVEILEQSSTGIGYTFGTNMYVGEMPDSPDACIAVYDTGGGQPAPNYTYDYPSIQVLVRGGRAGTTTYKDTWDIAKLVMDALHGLNEETWNGARYIQIIANSDIIAVGKDESKRPLFSIHFNIHRTDV